jgi:hypothetical protein
MFRLLCVGFALSFLMISPLGVQGQSVDSLQLMRDVRFLSSDAMKGRLAGTRESREAQLYLMRRFSAIGLLKRYDTYEQSFFFDKDGRRVMGTNILGYLKGTASGWIVISAHYDHLGTARPAVQGDSIYNGADDNASGVAGLLAIASYFKARPPKHNLLFVAFDAEEEGLQGSQAFVTREAGDLMKDIILNVNMDMISHSKPGVLYACGTRQFPWLKPLIARAATDRAIHLAFGHDNPDKPKDNWINQSDQGSFYAKGIPFVYFGVEDHPDYHQLTDEFRTISFSFYYRAVKLIIRAVDNLDRIEPPKAKIPPRNKWIMK